MRIWNYHPVTNELLGESVADANPIVEGEWLLPAFSTTTGPGESQSGRVYVFAGDAWESVADHRGETWWNDAGEHFLIGYLGEPAEGLTNVEPPAPPVVVPPIVVSARQIRLALNRHGWRAGVESYVAAADQDTRDTWQFGADFERGNSVIEPAAEHIGATPADVDELFELAKTL